MKMLAERKHVSDFEQFLKETDSRPNIEKNNIFMFFLFIEITKDVPKKS